MAVLNVSSAFIFSAGFLADKIDNSIVTILYKMCKNQHPEAHAGCTRGCAWQSWGVCIFVVRN